MNEGMKLIHLTTISSYEFENINNSINYDDNKKMKDDFESFEYILSLYRFCFFKYHLHQYDFRHIIFTCFKHIIIDFS